MKVLKKLTLKDLNNFKKGTLAAKCEEVGGEVFVGRIVGSVRAQESVPSPYGEALKFKGTFVGYSQNGEEARSVVAYLPSPIDQMLSDQINELQGDSAKLENPVEFALDVYAVSDKCEAGYKYVCKPLLETKMADPVAAIISGLPTFALPPSATTPALGQDKPEPETEAPAEEPAKSGKAGKK